MQLHVTLTQCSGTYQLVGITSKPHGLPDSYRLVAPTPRQSTFLQTTHTHTHTKLHPQAPRSHQGSEVELIDRKTEKPTSMLEVWGPPQIFRHWHIQLPAKFAHTSEVDRQLVGGGLEGRGINIPTFPRVQLVKECGHFFLQGGVLLVGLIPSHQVDWFRHSDSKG